MNIAAEEKNLISIICPVHNEQRAVPLFYARLKKVLDELSGFDYELIFTNNRSTDQTLSEIHKLQGLDQSVHVLTFSRNFGYQASILAGMKHARGDVTLVIDVDCEDPPELIPVFVQKWKEGHEIVYGIRGKRDEAKWITWFRLLFYRIMKFTADTDIILDMAEFALLSKTVRDILVKSTNTFPFLRAEIAYSGFKKVGVPYDRQKRIVGESHYNLYRMTLFAAAGIMTVSTFPLRAPIYFLPIIALLNIIAIALSAFGDGSWFQPVVMLDLLCLVFILIAQGLYIARIYKNGIGRPVYIIDWDLSDTRLNAEYRAR